MIEMNISRKKWSHFGCAVVLLFLFCDCSNDNKRITSDSVQDSAQLDTAFHADNDIAMTVRSIADAIRVGEQLDTADYNFTGVLTDGQGRPLYSDVNGAPGVWDVDVLSPTSATIKNVEVGDLLPEDLELYLVASLGLDESNEVDSLSHKGVDGRETSVYDFEGGYLKIDVDPSEDETGLERAKISITTSRNLPE